jgi:Fe-S-cluster-containing dehydrogenase component
MRWGMVIDKLRCVQCYSCQVSCKQAYFLPPGIFFNRVATGETGQYPMVRKHTFPLLCNHCTDAPCVNVCPTGASYQREDGIVLIDHDKCVGCKYCIMACPYQQRSSFKYKEQYPGQGYNNYEKFGMEHHPYQEGTAVKCNFCKERIDDGLAEGLTPGEDRAATPVCVNACPAKARTFGDMDDPESKIVRLIRERNAEQLRPDFDTDPSVYYIIS